MDWAERVCSWFSFPVSGWLVRTLSLLAIYISPFVGLFEVCFLTVPLSVEKAPGVWPNTYQGAQPQPSKPLGFCHVLGRAVSVRVNG